MDFLVKYELSSASPMDERRDEKGIIELVQNLPWEDELSAAEETTNIPGLDIINEAERRILTLSVMEKKEDVLFTVESLRTGKLQRGKTGTLINDLPHKGVVEVVEMFCRHDYSSIAQMDNTGFFSKFLRKMVFLFAADE